MPRRHEIERYEIGYLPRFAALAVCVRASRRLQIICPPWAQERLVSVSLIAETIARLGARDEPDHPSYSGPLRELGDGLLEDAARHGFTREEVRDATRKRLIGVSATLGLVHAGVDTVAGWIPERGIEIILRATGQLATPALFRLIRRDAYVARAIVSSANAPEDEPVFLEACGPLWPQGVHQHVREEILAAADGPRRSKRDDASAETPDDDA